MGPSVELPMIRHATPKRQAFTTLRQRSSGLASQVESFEAERKRTRIQDDAACIRLTPTLPAGDASNPYGRFVQTSSAGPRPIDGNDDASEGTLIPTDLADSDDD